MTQLSSESSIGNAALLIQTMQKRSNFPVTHLAGTSKRRLFARQAQAPAQPQTGGTQQPDPWAAWRQQQAQQQPQQRQQQQPQQAQQQQWTPAQIQQWQRQQQQQRTQQTAAQPAAQPQPATAQPQPVAAQVAQPQPAAPQQPQTPVAAIPAHPDTVGANMGVNPTATATTSATPSSTESADAPTETDQPPMKRPEPKTTTNSNGASRKVKSTSFVMFGSLILTSLVLQF